MSTIIATTLSNGSVSVPTATVVNGSAKAWVNFNGTGTIAARDSLNLSSLTDNGTGDYTVNFSNAFAAADYSITVQGYTSAMSFIAPRTTVGGFLAGSSRFLMVLSAGGPADSDIVSIPAHGDLA